MAFIKTKIKLMTHGLRAVGTSLGLSEFERFERWLLMISATGIMVGGLANVMGLSASRGPQNGQQKALATIVHSDQDVRHRPSTELVWNEAKELQELYRKDEVFTGKDSHTTINFPDSGSSIELDEDTLLVIDTVGRDDDLLGNLRRSLSGGDKGSVTVQVGGKPVSLTQGTKLKVTKREDGTVSMAVLAGQAEVHASGEVNAATVSTNQVIDVNSKSAAIVARVMPVLLDSPAPEARQAFRPGTVTSFAWHPQGEVASYRFEIRSAKGSKGDTLVVNTKSPRAEPGLLARGAYLWRVIAIGRDGKDLDSSEQRRFVLIDDRPPTLQYPPEGHIQTSYETVERSTPTVTTALAWAGEPGTYRVQLAKDEAFSSPLLDQALEGHQLTSPVLSAGTYLWRVKKEIAPDGSIVGAQWSEARHFSVRAVPLPAKPNAMAPTSGETILVRTNDVKIELKWAGPEDVRYEIQVARDRNFNEGLSRETVTGKSLAWRATGTGTFYWRLRSLDPSGRDTGFTAPSSFNVTLAGLTLKAPDAKERHVIEKSDAALEFTWETNPLASAYRFEVAKQADFSDTVVQEEVQSGHASWRELAKGSYFWRVIAVGSEGQTLTKSDVRSLVLLDARTVVAPDLTSPPPAQVLDHTKGDQHVEFAWAHVEGAVGYRLEVSEGESFERPLFSEVVREPHHLLSLPRVGAYRWRVGALVADDLPPRYGSTAEFHIIRSDPPSAPEALEPAKGTALITDEGKQELTFRWQPAEAKTEQNYELEVTSAADAKTPVYNAKGEDPATQAELPPGAYTWHVRTIDAYGQLGPWSRGNEFAIRKRPEAPEFINPRGEDKPLVLSYLDQLPTVMLRWHANSATKYRLEVASDDDFKKLVWQQELSRTQAQKELAPGTYFSRVAATDAQGVTSAWSRTLRVEIVREAALAAPTLLTPDSSKFFEYRRQAPSVAFVWEAVPRSKAYEIEIRKEGGETSIKEATGLTFAATLPAGSYQWRVRSLDASGRQGPWGETRGMAVRVNEARPLTKKPTSDLVVGGEEGREARVAFEWTAVKDLSGYKLVVSKDAGFKHIVAASDATPTTSATVALPAGQRYYWYVEGQSIAENAPVRSSVATFAVLTEKPDFTFPTHNLDLFALAQGRLVGAQINLDGSSSAAASKHDYAAPLLGVGIQSKPKKGLGFKAYWAQGQATVPDPQAVNGKGYAFTPLDANVSGLYRNQVWFPELTGQASLGFDRERSFITYADSNQKTHMKAFDITLAVASVGLAYEFDDDHWAEAGAGFGEAFKSGDEGVRTGHSYRFMGSYAHTFFSRRRYFMYTYEFLRSEFYFSDPEMGLGGTVQSDQYCLELKLVQDLGL